MKIYISAPTQAASSQGETAALAKAVQDAQLKDYWLARDCALDKKLLDNPKDRWSVIRDEIGACDALLIDVTNPPSDNRLVEIGIAYSQRLPVIVVKRQGVEHKALMDSVSEKVIEYSDYKDLTRKLRVFDRDRLFSVTDKSALLVMFLLVGAAIGWQLAQFFIPLALIGMIAYWMVVRQIFASMRAFDRIVILIPLGALWLAGLYWLKGVSLPLAIAWTLVYWIAALMVLRRLKLSL